MTFTAPGSRQALDQAQSGIRDDLLRMASLLESQLRDAIRALANRDMRLAHQVIETDASVNELRYAIENQCMTTIARQQPAARDLRAILAAIHMASELERIGDHTAGIASISIRLGEGPLIKPLIDIPRMTDITVAMIHDALDAYVRLDVELARAVAQRDSEVDAIFQQVLRELLTYMNRDSQQVSGVLYLQWVAHNLERIADRVTNLCERVIFVVTGELGDYKPEQPAI
jgi:phosphate transport system protein